MVCGVAGLSTKDRLRICGTAFVGRLCCRHTFEHPSLMLELSRLAASGRGSWPGGNASRSDWDCFLVAVLFMRMIII